MRGYVAQRQSRFYAVIYEGIDPMTARERRRWHPAGTDRASAVDFARELAAAHSRHDGRRVGPTLGVYLTTRWLPTKQLTLRPSTWDGYRRLIELHVLPHLGRVDERMKAGSPSPPSTTQWLAAVTSPGAYPTPTGDRNFVLERSTAL